MPWGIIKRLNLRKGKLLCLILIQTVDILNHSLFESTLTRIEFSDLDQFSNFNSEGFTYVLLARGR